MTDAAENIIDIQSLRSTIQNLVHIRKRLAHNMIVRVGGSEYESIFGCGIDVHSDLSQDIPHILVRVKLNNFDENSPDVPYRFEVMIEFNLPNKVNIKEADHFKRALNNAVKKAKWAQELVRGHVWDLRTIMSLRIY